MPVKDPSRYPHDWDAISRRIRFERAAGKCEWCGAPNGEWISRYKADPKLWRLSYKGYLGDQEWKKATRVVLTVHHIGIDRPDGSPGDPHDKMDVRDENLAALCNRCHLLDDLPLHMENAKRTRMNKLIEHLQAQEDAGQGRLF